MRSGRQAKRVSLADLLCSLRLLSPTLRYGNVKLSLHCIPWLIPSLRSVSQRIQPDLRAGRATIRQGYALCGGPSRWTRYSPCIHPATPSRCARQPMKPRYSGVSSCSAVRCSSLVLSDCSGFLGCLARAGGALRRGGGASPPNFDRAVGGPA